MMTCNNIFFKEDIKSRKETFKKIGEKVYDFFAEQTTNTGFQLRDGQLDMSCEIIDGLQKGKHVLVEAGVGIGKSFAYIVPILFYIQQYDKPVIIATSTIALQEQLKNDIEVIKNILNITVDVTIGKGQTHFLCKKRMDEYFTDKHLQKCSDEQIIYNTISKYGYEKSDWNINIPDKIWDKINIQEYNIKNCIGKCEYFNSCRYRIRRQKMITTKGIIVCNQDLLSISMQKKINEQNPLINRDAGLIIIDEAHNLESRVRSTLTSYLTIQILKKSINGVSKAIRYIDYETENNIENANQLIYGAFNELYKQVLQQNKKAEENGQDIDRYYVRLLGNSFRNLNEILSNIYFKASAGFGDYEGNNYQQNFEDEIEQLEDCIKFINSFLQQDNSNDLFWMECPKGSKNIENIRLYKCPKNVNKTIKKLLFCDDSVQVILTSATLTSGKSSDYISNYAYFIKNIGFPTNKGLICEPKDSPFNYNENAMIYYTEHLPHPTHDRIHFIEEGVKEIIRLLYISNGKALILFTAKIDMQEVYKQLLEQNLPFEILMQTGNSKQAEILDFFRSDTNSVLLGTGSFWEGINIEGASLSHVIIFKLPFPVREPIIDYKYSQSTPNCGLMEVSVPEMIIKLKQGIGRLIRNECDKGIISIIDSRIGKKSKAPYKNIIWDSLPIKNKTNKIEEIKEFYDNIISNHNTE